MVAPRQTRPRKGVILSAAKDPRILPEVATAVLRSQRVVAATHNVVQRRAKCGDSSASLRSAQNDTTRGDAEAGYLLLGAVVMVALVLISLAVAAPVIARDIRRDKEVESMHRAEQYVRAIRMYQRACKCQAYPPTMEALEKGTNVRYLRHPYIDPLTGKADWRLIHTPQTEIHIFFGKGFTDLPAGSLGSASNLATTTGSPTGIGGTSSSTIGATSNAAAGFQGASIGGSSGSTGSTGSTGSNSDAGMFGDSNGGPIKGVGTSRTGDSILNPNGQTTYETWEFWWDPRMELLYAKSNILGGGGIGSTSATGLGNNINGASGSTGTSGATGATGSTGGIPSLGGGFSPR